MKKSLRGCWAWCAFVVLVLIVFVVMADSLLVRHLSKSTGIFTRMSDDVKTVSIILRELSLDQTDRKDEWVLWPRTSEGDVSSNSTVFLRRLQKEPPVETLFPRMFEDMPTYPHAVASERCFFRENGESRWSLLVDPSESTPDFVPLVLSEGINVAVLCDLLTGKPYPARKVRLLKKGDEWGVLHFKDWKIFFLNSQSFEVQKRERTMKMFGKMSPPYVATYLTPTGLVSVTFRSL